MSSATSTTYPDFVSAKITVVVREPGSKAVVREIEATLAAQQAVVGGYIELLQQVHACCDDGAVLNVIANEDGHEEGLSPNVYLRDDMVLVGTLLAVKAIDGTEVSLTGDEIERVRQLVDSFRVAAPMDN